MKHSNNTPAKILILDIRKFKQQKFRIQQYLQEKHYALWEVIKFRDSYVVPTNDTATVSTSEGTATKKGRTVALTTEDMQKRRNDVKARTTLLLAFPDEHQLRFSKYKMAQELWASVLKTFGGNEATKKTKKNLFKQQYGNFKAEGKETLERTFNRLQAIVSQMEFMDVEIESDLDMMSLDDLYNHLKVYEPEVQKKSDSHNMAFISSSKNDSLSQVEGRLVEFKNQEIKFCEKIRVLEFNIKGKTNIIEYLTKELENLKNEKECLESKLTGFKLATKDLDYLIGSQRSEKIKEGLGYSAVPPPPAQVYSLSKKDMSWTGLPEFDNDTITDYTRPSPSVESNLNDLQNSSSSASENGESTGGILSKPEIKFVRPADTRIVVKTDKVEIAKKPTVNLGVKKGRTCLTDTHMSTSPRPVVYKTHRPPMRLVRPNMNVIQPKRTSFHKPAHLYNKRPFQRTSAVRSQFRGPRVATVNRKFPTVNRKLPTVNRKFPTGNTKFSTTDLGNISYLTNYEPFDGGYVSFGQGGCKITGKGTIKTGKLMFENVYFVKDLKTPRQHNMYTIDLNKIVSHKDLTCLVAKTSADESMLWHKRLGHLNFKTINKLVRHNLVRGLPTKCFENDHNCSACLKGKQHKASCKTKLVNSMTKPLHTLHMDLFGPISVSSLNHKWYFLVVTDDFSRFTWTFFLKTKDESSGILRNFITEIENLKEIRVKIIRCDNGGEFRNKEMNNFYSRKGIKREFINTRTPQQNGVAKRRNMTLIEAARTMLADAKLPVTFWAEAVNTACYVQNRVLVNKSQNKTPYELFNGRSPAIGFLKLFGCHVMILNTLDNLGKFKAKGDEGYFIGYSMSSKAFRVFNKRTKRVEENLHVDFLENKPIEKGTNSTNFSGTKEAVGQDMKKDVPSLRYIVLPNWFHKAYLESSTGNAQDTCSADAPKSSGNSNPTATSTNPPADHIETLAVETLIPTVSSPVPTACLNDSPKTLKFEDNLGVTTNTDDTNGVEVDLGNMETTITASPTPTLRIHKDNPKSQIIGPVDTPIQTKNKSKEIEEQSFIATIYQKTNPSLLLFCLFLCFLSQKEPKKISDAL
nr:hypothetical protein [Tanacetum cinerariifolium]